MLLTRYFKLIFNLVKFVLELNYKINMRIDRSFENKNNKAYEKEIELLKKNIENKKLSEKQIQNNELYFCPGK